MGILTGCGAGLVGEALNQRVYISRGRATIEGDGQITA